jgi:hypothetical protein
VKGQLLVQICPRDGRRPHSSLEIRAPQQGPTLTGEHEITLRREGLDMRPKDLHEERAEETR